MLSRQLCSLHEGCESHTTAAASQLLAFPLHPHLFLTSIPLALQQHSLGVPSPPLTPDHLHHTTKTQSDYVESGPQFAFPKHTTKEVARRMMPPPFSSTVPISSRHIKFTFTSNDTTNTLFTFRALPRPEMALSFPPAPSSTRPAKRSRAVADVDGDYSSLHKKKRRLRLFLITSRLSPHYSHPATNIVDRGSSKIAVWAKQKALGRNLLRKAAVLNRIRRQAITVREASGGLGRVLIEQEREQEQLHMAKMAFTYGSHDSHTRPVFKRIPSSSAVAAVRAGDHFEISGPSPSTSPSGSPSPPLCARDAEASSEYRSPNDAYSYSPPRSTSPRRSYLPLPPSPLGLSNYDAFDLEDELPGPYDHLDDDFDSGDQEDDMRDDTPYPATGPSTSRPAVCRDGSEPSTTPQSIYSDFSILDPDEPVLGDYDQTEEGADAIWPSALAPEAQESLPIPSSSPDFPALFATAPGTVPLSPNFTTSPPLDWPASPTAVSPNFPAIVEDVRGMSVSGDPRVPRTELDVGRDDGDLEAERKRQRNFMFMQFGS